MNKFSVTCKSISMFVLFFLTMQTILNAQLHSAPNCGENFTLNWSSSPSAINEYNWLTAGALSRTFSNVDNSGIDFTVTFTGETSSLGYWGGVKTPKVGTSASGSSLEFLDIVTNGFSSTGITCTITFSKPIYALSFDLSHVNSNGTNGDKYTITAKTTGGDTLYPNFTSSSNPSYTTNNATGVVDANRSSVSGDRATVGVNFLDEDYIESVTFLWQNCSTCSPNVMHGSGLGNFSFCIPQTLDFDGVNDYIDRTAFLGAKSEVTMMSWIKLDNGFNGGEIMGQRNFRLYVDSNKRLRGFARTNTGISVTSPSTTLSTLSDNMWYHVALKYSSSSGNMELYLNGRSIWSYTNITLLGTSLNNQASWNSNHDFEIGRNTEFNNNYFEGSIYECRVYNKALTINQLHRQINQEIENNAGSVRGSVISKNIDGLLWSDLELYYKMGVIETGYTPDSSSSGVDGHLNNMRTYQEYTAPLPYVTTSACSGNWTNSNNWVHGDIWDITTAPPESAIVQIKGSLEVDKNVSTVGLILDNGSELRVKNDSGLVNTWYLELNGTLDLQDDSQLVQTNTSDLVTSIAGKLLRRQEGTGNAYWYNYWSSPVGEVNVTTLSNNNASLNNSNNSNFKLNLLKDEAGLNWSFTDGYSGNGTISTYWLYTFINGVTYWDWSQLATNTPIKPGVGYTQKGVGKLTDQQYVFEGKPNNGTILLNVLDKGGAGSIPTVTETTYLMGNPYPSALSIDKFIDDNTGVIDGVLQLWQQWSGSSHNLNEYNGGYAQVNKLGATRAFQFVGINGAHNGSQDGTKVPTKYLPVGQGFITEIVADGKVEFNNSQRVFIKEADANGSFNSGSVFLKNGNDKKASKEVMAKAETEENNKASVFKKLRLEMQSVSGPETHRELLLGFSDITSDAYDYGYDAENVDINNNDIHLNLEGKDMNIQAYGVIEIEKVVPLNFKSSGDNSFEIKLTEVENFDDEEEIYLKDNLTGTYFDLTKNTAYRFSSFQGKFNKRFEIVFQSEQESLSVQELAYNQNFVYYLNKDRKLYAKKLKASIKRLALVNMLGQSVLELENVSQNTLENGIDIPVLATGSYVAYFRSNDNQVFTKKMVVK